MSTIAVRLKRAEHLGIELVVEVEQQLGAGQHRRGLPGCERQPRALVLALARVDDQPVLEAGRLEPGRHLAGRAGVAARIPRRSAAVPATTPRTRWRAGRARTAGTRRSGLPPAGTGARRRRTGRPWRSRARPSPSPAASPSSAKPISRRPRSCTRARIAGSHSVRSSASRSIRYEDWKPSPV